MSKAMDELTAAEFTCEGHSADANEVVAVPASVAARIITEQEQRIAELEALHAGWLVERAELTALATGLEAERDAYRDALAKHQPPAVAVRRDEQTKMTKPITDIESPEQIAERLLPCANDVDVVGTVHGPQCPVYYRPAIAAALRVERERALHEALTVIAGVRYENRKDDNCDLAFRLIEQGIRALAQKGNR